MLEARRTRLGEEAHHADFAPPWLAAGFNAPAGKAWRLCVSARLPRPPPTWLHQHFSRMRADQ